MTITDQMILRFTVDGDAQMKNALANYTVNADRASAATQRFGRATGGNAQVAQNFGRVISDLPYGFMAISNNIEPLLFSLGASGGLTLAFTLAAAAGVILEKMMPNMISKFFDLGKAAKAAKQEGLDAFTESLGKLNIKNLEKSLDGAKQLIRNYERELKELPNKKFDVGRGKSSTSDAELDAIFNPGRMAGDKNFQTSQRELRAVEQRDLEKKLGATKELLTLIEEEATKRKVIAELVDLQNTILVKSTNPLLAITAEIDIQKKLLEDTSLTQGKIQGIIDKIYQLEKKRKELGKSSEERAKEEKEQREKAYEYMEKFNDREKKLLKEVADYEAERREHIAEMAINAQENAIKKQRTAIDTLEAGFYGVARGIEDSFTKAFQNAFGEANSLLEMFALAAGQQLLFSLVGTAIGGVGGGGLLGAIFGGATGGAGGKSAGVGISPVIGGNSRPIVINLQIGRKAMRAVVSDAQSENVRLRLT